MSEEKSTWQQMLAKRAEWAEQQPSLGAEIRAMAREAVKDVRSTVMETFPGSPEHGGEPGTPLNPTMQQVTQDLGNIYGSYQAMIDSYATQGREAKQQDRDNHMER